MVKRQGGHARRFERSGDRGVERDVGARGRPVEGDKKREQAYEGVVIAKRNKGLNSSFIVRKISSGEGVERTFQTYSPAVASIEIKRRGQVRRAKLYYLRDRSGKSARIREKLKSVADREVLPPEEPAAG